MKNKLFEKKLKSLSSKDFENITAKDEDWKYLGKKIFELNDIEIGKIELNRYQTFFEIDKDFADKLKSNIKKIDFRGNEIILDSPMDFDEIPSRKRKDRRKSVRKNSSRKKGKKRKKKKSRFK